MNDKDDKGLWIKFIIEEEKTKFGENVYIVGSEDSLGKWDINNSKELKTNNEKEKYLKFPKWESDFIKFDKNVKNDEKLQYKYLIKDQNGNLIRWEQFEGNRELDLSKYYDDSVFVIDDGNFSDKSKREVFTLEDFNKKYSNINNEVYNNKEVYENNIEEKKNLENSDEIKLQETNKIGLQNIGSTCYMNATLQCFCHIRRFISYFKEKNFNKLSQDTLSISFKKLIDHLWSKDLSPNKIENNYYIPTDFRAKIANKSDLFQNNVANDAKDLVNFIIMTLHDELNKAKKNNTNNFQNGVMINQFNKKLVLENFVKEFEKNNKSIISEIFYAMNLSETQCTFCKKILYNYQIYYFIVFPLEEVRKFKYPQFYINNNFNNYPQYNQINNYNNIPKEVSIYDCFEYDRKMNNMIGQNQMYCNYCKANTNCIMVTKLVTGPEVLILLLNRGKGLEFDVKINFVEYLNLENYIEKKNTGYYYELLGVITHIGENGQGGHFIAYCRDPFTNVWSKYNDAIVTEVNNFKK